MGEKKCQVCSRLADGCECVDNDNEQQREGDAEDPFEELFEVEDVVVTDTAEGEDYGGRGVIVGGEVTQMPPEDSGVMEVDDNGRQGRVTITLLHDKGEVEKIKVNRPLVGSRVDVVEQVMHQGDDGGGGGSAPSSGRASPTSSGRVGRYVPSSRQPSPALLEDRKRNSKRED